MKNNIDSKERIMRVIVAAIAGLLGYIISPWFYAITVFALIVAATGHCPVLPKDRCKKGSDCCGGACGNGDELQSDSGIREEDELSQVESNMGEERP